MHNFFHCNTNIYIKRRKLILLLTLPALFAGALITALVTLVNLRAFHEGGHVGGALAVISVCAVVGTLIFFVTFSVTERAIRRGARFTFLQTGGGTLIFSRYAGAYLSLDGLILYRKLYVLPLAALKAVGYDERSGAVFLETDGAKIRAYSDRSDRLNFKLIGNKVEFESWWYNENGFETLSELKIPPLFSNPQFICSRIAAAKKEIENIPERKPYVHKETEYARRKKAQKKWKNFLNE